MNKKKSSINPIRKILLNTIGILAVAYLFWEVYWARKVGYSFIKWHTHLALYFYIWLIFCGLLYLLQRIFKWKNYLKFQVLTGSVFFTLLLLEIVLYTTGKGDTYMELIKFGYASRYDARYETYYRLHQPHETFHISRPEFDYLFHANSLGYSDVEWPVDKKPNEKRFLFLGDSFTEGVGAPSDSNYVSQLRLMLGQKDSNYYVMNGGISGDDPCINFVDYRDGLEIYKPDYIVQTFSSNDMNTDIITKGGLERFKADKTVRFRSGPWWEPIYAMSHVSRILFTALGYNEFLTRMPLPKKEKDALDRSAIEMFTAYAAEAKKHGTTLIVILQPNQGEINQKGYEYDLSPMVRHLHTLKNVSVYDLRPFYQNEFEKNKEKVRDYYWRQDGHHNSKGYLMMARGVMCAIDSFAAIKNN
jgi:lysophospholipase L1-like esterase